MRIETETKDSPFQVFTTNYMHEKCTKLSTDLIESRDKFDQHFFELTQFSQWQKT